MPNVPGVDLARKSVIGLAMRRHASGPLNPAERKVARTEPALPPPARLPTDVLRLILANAPTLHRLRSASLVSKQWRHAALLCTTECSLRFNIDAPYENSPGASPAGIVMLFSSLTRLRLHQAHPGLAPLRFPASLTALHIR